MSNGNVKRTLCFNLKSFPRGFSHHTDAKANLSIKTARVVRFFTLRRRRNRVSLYNLYPIQGK